jgi:hypothetical protein
MNILRNLILGVVAVGAFAIATPAQAHDHHRYYGHSYGHYYSHGPRFYGGVTYGSPYYYSYSPYYYNDDYYRPYPYYYGYNYGPGVTFAFGGHGHYYHHHHHR